MAKYDYVDSSGKMASVEAKDAQTALSTAPNIAKNSGVSESKAVVADAASALNSSTGATTAGKGIVSSSDSVVADENNVKNDIKTMSAPSYNADAARKASAAYMKLLDDQAAALERQRQEEIQGINESFKQTKTETKETQAKETASTGVALQRIGGYLGNSASATGALVNLSQTHQRDMLALDAKKRAAIQAANSAINDKQFQLAREKAKEAKDIEAEIADRNEKFFDQSLALSREERSQDVETVDKVAPAYADAIRNMPEMEAAAFIQNAAKDLKIDPSLLLGEVSKIYYNERKTEIATVSSLASKYISAGINPNEDTFESASAKVRGSREYLNDIRKAELDIANSSSSLKDKSIDYSNPLLTLYANATGKIVTSPSEARAVMGYAESVLGDKEIIADDTPLPAQVQGTITESDARRTLSDAFAQFNKDDTISAVTVNEWLSSPEALLLDDQTKKAHIIDAGQDPEDFGLY